MEQRGSAVAVAALEVFEKDKRDLRGFGGSKRGVNRLDELRATNKRH